MIPTWIESGKKGEGLLVRSFREVLERYDSLWEEAETLVDIYFTQYRRAGRQGVCAEGGAAAPQTKKMETPDLKELNTAVAVLKRIQDARRAIHLDAIKLEVSSRDAKRNQGKEKPDPMDNREISRILRLLEESNGSEETADEGEV
ncbi:MAG TPA: hypothetical protein VM492_00930 [Sumerlaeia bacterium]|nr:hypothetical protein [Sumerlaeia bacterium]